jgi:hypothetical protein
MAKNGGPAHSSKTILQKTLSAEFFSKIPRNCDHRQFFPGGEGQLV